MQRDLKHCCRTQLTSRQVSPKHLLCALTDLLGDTEKSDKELKEAYAKRKVAPDRLERTSKCAKRWQFCGGRYRNSKGPCCEDPSDECKVIGPHFSACSPKRGASCSRRCHHCQCDRSFHRWYSAAPDCCCT